MSIVHDRKQGRFHQWIGWICLLTLIDQASKAYIRATLLPGSRFPLIAHILFITFVPNYHGFSWFMPDLPEWFHLLFLVMRLIIMVLVFPVYAFYTRTRQASRWAWISLVTVSAGITGNLLDDVFVEYTADFIQVLQSPSANFADLFSYAGIGTLAVELGLQWKDSPEKRVQAGKRHNTMLRNESSGYTGCSKRRKSKR